MKIRDNETGEVFEYGENIHHALRISRNGGCLIFENLQNGDGSLENGDGGYSFVLDDGMTPKESDSPDAINYATYANIGGFHGDTAKNDGWISVEESLPERTLDEKINKSYKKYLVFIDSVDGWDIDIALYDFWNDKKWREAHDGYGEIENAIAWRPLPEPYKPERSRE